VPKAESRDLFTPAPLPQARLDHAQRLACLRLIRSEQVGPVTFRELINHFGGADRALAALPELARRGGRRKPIRLCPREEAEAELEAAARVRAEPLFTIEPGYPAALARVDVPPPLLYVKGRTELLARPTVAIVGSRNASAAGQKLTRQISAAVGADGFVIASGLARGIDASAHEAALATGTVAVLAGGIDFVYPPEHAALQDRIAAEGCLISEQPPGFAPRGQDFPRRNRIISGISVGVLIVEAARRSGSLITARMAGEQGREVLAVPGHPLDPRAEGTNQLLKEGATLVTQAADVLAALAPLVQQRVFSPGTAPAGDALVREEGAGPGGLPEEGAVARVLDALGPAPVDIDWLARATGLDIRSVRIALLELALADRIERHGAQLVSRKAP
jgi:DNA processing protein